MDKNLSVDANKICDAFPSIINIIYEDYGIWQNRESLKEFPKTKESDCCYQIIYGADVPCPACPVREVFLTGLRQQIQRKIKERHYIAKMKPLKDDRGIIVAVIEELIDITESAEQTRNLEQMVRVCEEMSITDYLTNALNRRGGIGHLKSEVDRCKRYGNKFSLIMFDLDDFKSVNDTMGHAAGDELLIRVSGIVKSIIRDSDTICRYGGDEFMLIFPETELSGAEAVAKKIGNAIEMETSITISSGVVEYNNPSVSYENILKISDQLMYDSKKKGKNNTTSYK